MVEATSRDVARKSAEAAEQNLQKAAEDLRGTMSLPQVATALSRARAVLTLDNGRVVQVDNGARGSRQ